MLQLSQRCEEAEALAEALAIEKEALQERLAATEERLQAAIESGKDTENAAMVENERRAAALNEVCSCTERLPLLLWHPAADLVICTCLVFNMCHPCPVTMMQLSLPCRLAHSLSMNGLCAQ